MAEQNRLYDLWLTARGIDTYRSLLRNSQYWSADRMAEYQYERCRRLLIYAYEHTEYYQRAFWHAAFDPYRCFRGLDDLSRVPRLTKAEARAQQAALCDPAALPRAMELRTSGTTGEVFRAYVSPEHWVMEQGIVWRHWSWLGYRFRDRMAILRSYAPRPGQPYWRLDRARNFLYFSAYHLTPANAREYLRVLADWRPTVLRGYPSALYLLAQVALASRWQPPLLKGVLTASETVLPQYREAIERAFRTRVFDWYGQGECTVTLNECEAHEGLHVNAEYGICELVPDLALAPNERRIVATNLTNTAMPLIRYDTGDVAILRPGGERCSCGRGLPLVDRVRGRADDFLVTPDGRRIPSVNLYTMMYGYDGVVAFQFVQEIPERIEVRLETADFAPLVGARLMRDLRDRFGSAVEIELLENRGFVQSADGKRPVIIARANHAA